MNPIDELMNLAEDFGIRYANDMPIKEAKAELRAAIEQAIAAEREACAQCAELSDPADWAFIGVTIRARGSK